MKETRAYFINYIVPMINNYLKCSSCDDLICNKIKIWTALLKIQGELNWYIAMINIAILLSLSKIKMICILLVHI